jgi:hypothetical protein
MRQNIAVVLLIALGSSLAAEDFEVTRRDEVTVSTQRLAITAKNQRREAVCRADAILFVKSSREDDFNSYNIIAAGGANILMQEREFRFAEVRKFPLFQDYIEVEDFGERGVVYLINYPKVDYLSRENETNDRYRATIGFVGREKPLKIIIRKEDFARLKP